MQILECLRQPLVAISFYSPSLVAEVGFEQGRVICYSSVDTTNDAVRRRCDGDIDPDGTRQGRFFWTLFTRCGICAFSISIRVLALVERKAVRLKSPASSTTKKKKFSHPKGQLNFFVKGL